MIELTSEKARPAPAERVLGTPRFAAVFGLLIFLATTLQVIATPLAALGQGLDQWPLPVSEPIVLTLLILGCGVQATALAVSDRFPQLAVATVTVVFVALAIGLEVPTWLTGMYLVIALSLFLLATRRSAVVAVAWLILSLTAAVGSLFVWLLSEGSTWAAASWWIVAEAVQLGAPAAAATLMGLWWQGRARRMREARDAADDARRQHEDRVADAQADERARIAQELHDVAGQHLAGLITLADAALKLAPQKPESAIELVQEVRDEGRFAAASLSTALSDLRATTPASTTTLNDLRSIQTLLDYWRDRGAVVTESSDERVVNLPAVVSTTAYRCIQEGLTNAAKYAPGAPVHVGIDVRPEALHVEVTNGPAELADPLPGLGLGWGLRGIAERVAVLQGTMSTSRLADGGWKLEFHLPTYTSST